MYVYCSIREGEPDQNRLAVDVRDFTPFIVMMLIVLFQKLKILSISTFLTIFLYRFLLRKILNNKIVSFSL